MQPDPCLRFTRRLWADLTSELHLRTEGHHESGAFLLGRNTAGARQVVTLVYYDELDPTAYETGVCVLHADAFGRLWEICKDNGLSVVADAHVHGGRAGQSESDRKNPMVARPGHIALIFPRMARAPIRRWSVGFYEYLGSHEWRAHGGCGVGRFLKIEDDR